MKLWAIILWTILIYLMIKNLKEPFGSYGDLRIGQIIEQNKAIHIMVSGGKAPYQIMVYDQSSLVSAGHSKVEFLPTGWYRIVVRDQNQNSDERWHYKK